MVTLAIRSRVSSMAARSIQPQARPACRAVIPVEHRSRGPTGNAGPGIAKAVVTPDTTNGLTPQRRRPNGAKTAAAVERRSKPKCLVVLPVTKATLVVGEQSEVKFEPGIEC